LPGPVSKFENRPVGPAKLLKINKLLKSPKVHHGPLAGPVSVFRMSDMQFYKAQVRAVKAKTDTLGISFSIGEGGILQTQVWS